MSAFESLSIKQLKHILHVKMSTFDKDKKIYIQKKEDAVSERPSLIELVTEYIEEKEIENLLLKPDPESNSSKKKDLKAAAAQEKAERSQKLYAKKNFRGSGGIDKLSPDQMRQNAAMMRKDPGLVRKSNPALANYTNEQIKELADQLEKMAENPEMVKQAEQFMKMSPKDREVFQKGAGDMMGNPDKIPDDAQIDAMCKMLKSNPKLFKDMLKSNGMFPGQTDEQIDSYIDQLQKMDASTLKTVISGTGKLQKYLKPLKEIYEKVDKATGCAKYIAGFIALVLGALLLWLLWFVLKYVWYLLRSLVGLIVGSSSMKSTIDPQSLQANSPIEKDSLGAQIPNKVDNEFDF